MVEVDGRPDEAGDPVGSELNRLVGSGARWSLVNNVVIRLGTLLSGVVLARLLTPDDYGVYAVALVVLTVLLSMNEMGVSLAIIRWESALKTFAPTVMTLSVVSSTVLFASCYMLAPHLSSLMNTPEATEVLRLLCFLVLVDGVAAVPSGILTRRFLQARRFAADFSDFVISTAVTIVLAAAGQGALSFAWGRIAGGLVGIGLIWILCPVNIMPGWDARQARALLRFGLPLAGSSLLVFILLNVDYVVVGRELDTAQLGFYLLAFNLSSWPVNLFVEAARRVSFAGFSRLADRPDGLGPGFQRGIGLLMAITVPVCALLGGFADPIIEFLYGARWLPAAVVLEVLALLGLLRAIYLIGYDALVAVGRYATLIKIQLAWLALLLPALVIGARLDGIRGVGIGHVAVALLLVMPAVLAALGRHGVEIQSFFGLLGPPSLGAALIILVSVIVQRQVAGTFTQLAIGGIASAVAYAAVMWPFRRLYMARQPFQGEL